MWWEFYLMVSYCAPPPNSMLNRTVSVVRNPRWENLHHRKWQMPQPPAPFLSGRPTVTRTPLGVTPGGKGKFTSLVDASRVQCRQTAQQQPAVCNVEGGSERGHAHTHLIHTHTPCTPHPLHTHTRRHHTHHAQTQHTTDHTQTPQTHVPHTPYTPHTSHLHTPHTHHTHT